MLDGKTKAIARILRDVPDEEVIAYGTEEQIDASFDGDIEGDFPTEEEKIRAKAFVDNAFEELFQYDVRVSFNLTYGEYIINEK